MYYNIVTTRYNLILMYYNIVTTRYNLILMYYNIVTTWQLNINVL